MPVIYNKKVEYAYTDPGVKAHTLSWAEYQALSEDDKMNGDLYFIPDKQPEGNPSRIWTKLGTDPLTTQADDVSGAVNELNSSLANSFKIIDTAPIDVTTNQNGFTQITPPTTPTGYTLLATALRYWSSMTTPSAISIDAPGTYVLTSANNTIKGLRIRYIYVKTSQVSS